MRSAEIGVECSSVTPVTVPATLRSFLILDAVHQPQASSQSVIDFCQKRSLSMSEADRERVWHAFLDKLLLPQRTDKNSTGEQCAAAAVLQFQEGRRLALVQVQLMKESNDLQST